MSKMVVSLNENSYPIYIEHHLLSHLSEYLDSNRRYVIIADDGIPRKWVDLVSSQIPDGKVLRFAQGEASKSFDTFAALMTQLAELKLTRKDCLIALGGGVTGDLCGFLAACYMRGIDYIQIPTTVLSQVDSSVGGKTAIDVGTMKNLCGAFWQPEAVFIDPEVLSTLDPRQISAGLAEALKMSIVFDKSLLEEFEKEKPDFDRIIERSIDLKRQIVQEDEKEGGRRKLLNFGHTIGHAIEASFPEHDYLHGECVGMGMLYFIEDEELKKRVAGILKSLNLPEIPDYDKEAVKEYMKHDKKSLAGGIDAIFVSRIGQPEIRMTDFDTLCGFIDNPPIVK